MKSEEEYLFSIIMPTYNREDKIIDAIESVLNQHVVDWELLVIDNASTDNTKGVLAKVMKQDSRVKYLYVPEKGVSHARNIGIAKSKGKYICFLDDDDTYTPNCLHLFTQAIISNDYCIGVYRSFVIWKYTDGRESKQDINLYDDFRDNKIRYLLNNVVTVNCLCIEKTIFRNLLFEESLSVAEDYHLWLRIVSEYPLICIPHHTSFYNISESTASSGSVETYKKYIKAYKHIFSDAKIKDHISKKETNNIIAKYYIWLMFAYAGEHNTLKVFSSYLSFAKLTCSIKELKPFLSSVRRSF